MLASAIAIIRLVVVSSRICVWPASLRAVAGRHVQAGDEPADVVRRFVERVAGRDVATADSIEN